MKEMSKAKYDIYLEFLLRIGSLFQQNYKQKECELSYEWEAAACNAE